MELWAELFSDWVGILSFGVIAVTLLIGMVYLWYFLSHIGDDPQ